MSCCFLEPGETTVHDDGSARARAEPVRRPFRKLLGGFLVISGMLACPCHLPVTLPLLAGTALGAYALGHVPLVVAVLAIYFLVAFSLGFRLLGGEARDERRNFRTR